MEYLKPSFETITNGPDKPLTSIYPKLSVSSGYKLNCKMFMLDEYADMLGISLDEAKEQLSMPGFTPQEIFVSTQYDNPIVLVRGTSKCPPTLLDDFLFSDNVIEFYAMYSPYEEPIRVSSYAAGVLFGFRGGSKELIRLIKGGLTEYRSENI